jgi:uroporphyrin-III C-methyltransferase
MLDVTPPQHLGSIPAHVTLVGAGPGDPELLTVKAVKALSSAQTVLYDNLVSDDVLALCSSQAEKIYVGKQASRHALPQEEICRLLVQMAQAGRSVLRLKGGDGYIFGRGGEEAQALAQAGIPFSVIPGLTAAQGAAANHGIPLTHRDHSRVLVFATGHLKQDKSVDLDWEVLSRPRQTVVIYMGLGTLPVISAQLIAHGLSASTPAALIEKATTPQERCITGSVAELPRMAREHQLTSPTLIVIGEVVSLRDQLQPHLNDVLANK